MPKNVVRWTNRLVKKPANANMEKARLNILFTLHQEGYNARHQAPRKQLG